MFASRFYFQVKPSGVVYHAIGGDGGECGIVRVVVPLVRRLSVGDEGGPLAAATVVDFQRFMPGLIPQSAKPLSQRLCHGGTSGSVSIAVLLTDFWEWLELLPLPNSNNRGFSGMPSYFCNVILQRRILR
jgi:hypothetical protein